MPDRPENPPAFPNFEQSDDGTGFCRFEGMLLRDWFAGQALANPAICTGTAPDWQLRSWFGERGGLMPWEIGAKQAGAYADAMLLARGEQ